jgi:outer membrane protein assembly factor BamD
MENKGKFLFRAPSGPVIFLLALLLALAACGKPTEPPFDPEAYFKDANEKLDDKLYEEGRQKLEKIIRMDTEYVYAPLAQLRLADSYVMDDEPDLAVEEYRRFLDTYPRHKYSSYAQYRIGGVFFDLIKGPERGYGPALNAMDAFLDLNERYPRNPYRREAGEKIQECRRIIAEHEMMVGEFYLKRRAYHGAMDRLEGLVRDFQEFEDNPRVLWLMTLGYKGLGKDELSAGSLARLEELFPKSKYLKKARKGLKKIEKRKLKEQEELEEQEAEGRQEVDQEQPEWEEKQQEIEQQEAVEQEN